LLPPLRRQDLSPAVAAPVAAWWARLGAIALACLAGAFAAIATLGPRILDINDLGWLLHGTLGPDPVAYWLSWTYFAPAPWSWPPAMNPNYGLELASSIFYVDLVPLAAILAKALRPLVEIPQYWGPWLVLSAGLMAFFGWRLLRLVTDDPVALVFGATLFAWQPMLLNRMGGHFALVAQWVLLWALWLCLRGPRRGQAANFGADWEPVARFAASHGLPTEAVYLSRVDPDDVARLRLRTLVALREGRWDRRTLYILRNAAAASLVARSATPGRDLLARVDGVTVFAPDWYLPQPSARD
jgi:hypothetical protein